MSRRISKESSFRFFTALMLSFFSRGYSLISQYLSSIRFSNNHRLANVLLLCFGVLNLGACQAQPEMLGTPVSGYNHTSSNINRFTVNGAGGPNIGPYQGGLSSQTCCTSLPRSWNPGLKAIVEWESDPAPRAAIKRDKYGQIESGDYSRHAANYTHHKAIVDIPKYDDKFCALQVHFLSCDKVRVSTTCYTPEHPDYPDSAYFNSKESSVCPSF